LEQPFRVAHNSFGKEVTVRKNRYRMAQGGWGVGDAVEAGGILSAKPVQILQRPIGFRYRRQKHLNARGDSLGQEPGEGGYFRAGSCRVAKVNLFKETRHEMAQSQFESHRYRTKADYSVGVVVLRGQVSCPMCTRQLRRLALL
jgi:hypothetical protein